MITLYYTPRSHFSRKVRILLDAWQLETNLVDVGNVADALAFGDNPLMKVPCLVDDEVWIIDSDHIARYLVGRSDPADRFGVLTQDPAQLNLRAIMNGVMAAEVELLLAERGGLDTRKHDRFHKIRRSIRNGLQWLESNVSLIPDRPSYAGFHLVCMWDHLALYQTVKLEYAQLEKCVAQWSSLPYVAASAPV